MNRELEILVHLAGGQRRVDDRGHEVVAFWPADVAKLARLLQLPAVRRYANLGAEADALDLVLSVNPHQFLLRELRNQQVYETCGELDGIERALNRRRREEERPGKQTRGLQGLFHNWIRANARNGD